ncbi:hypothetical protein [Alteribacillus sp. HJP-4]|uniref:hypothetical protein n=1 Tax=Alteribacillus sp. HJP-4 TaxID=2775394 RepID=UPI0035CD3BEF
MADTSAGFTCNSCGSRNVVLMTKWRYVFFMSSLPLVTAVLLGFLFHSVFYLFTPGIILMNIILAGKKAPVKICKDCKQMEYRARPDLSHN